MDFRQSSEKYFAKCRKSLDKFKTSSVNGDGMEVIVAINFVCAGSVYRVKGVWN